MIPFYLVTAFVIVTALGSMIRTRKKSIDIELRRAVTSLLVCYHVGKLHHKDEFPRDFFNDAYLFFMPDGSIKAILNTDEGRFSKDSILEVINGEAVRVNGSEKIVPKLTLCLGRQDPLWTMRLRSAAGKLSNTRDPNEMLKSLDETDEALITFYQDLKVALYREGVIPHL
jgi:hypothetical protein